MNEPIWTIPALKEHLETIIFNLKEHFEKVLIERDKAVSIAFTSAKEAVAQALASVKEENRKTEIAAEERFKLLNELRGDVATIQQLNALREVVDGLKEQMTLNVGAKKGINEGWIWVVGGFGLVSTILGIIATVFSIIFYIIR